MPFGAHHERRAGRGRAALDGPGGADAAHAPPVFAPARVDEELDALTGYHRIVGRLRREGAHGEARLPGDLTGLRRQRHRGADVARAVGDRCDDHVRAGRERARRCPGHAAGRARRLEAATSCGRLESVRSTRNSVGL